MLTPGIKFVNFKVKSTNPKVLQNLKFIINENNEILKSLSKFYKNSFKIQKLKKFYKNKNFRIIGIGGSSLGAQAIYEFLKKKIKKNFEFVDNLIPNFRKSHKKIYKYYYFKVWKHNRNYS